MQSAAPASRPHPVTDPNSPSPTAPLHAGTQDPALVSQLQSRFDALALEEAGQGQDRPLQGGEDDAVSVGVRLDHQPSLLVLDGELQSLPWESLPCLGCLR